MGAFNSQFSVIVGCRVIVVIKVFNFETSGCPRFLKQLHPEFGTDLGLHGSNGSLIHWDQSTFKKFGGAEESGKI